MYCTWAAAPTIVGNVIRWNRAGSGGGIFCQRSPARIRDNQIYWNFALGNGGGINCNDHCFALIVNNLVFDNVSTFKGGGLYSNLCSPLIVNCTFVGNHAVYGGGILAQYDSLLVIHNTILWDDSATSAPEIQVGLVASDGSQAILSHCVVDGGLASILVQASSVLNWGEGMGVSDPLFVDLLGRDLHLRPRSPCRDAGVYVLLPCEDFEGDPRVMGAAVDIGADELLVPAGG